MKKNIRFLVTVSMTAALYAAVTIFIAAFNLASGVIQVRISEALTILPIFTPAAIPGLFIGCILANFLSGCLLPDIIFGSLATLIAAAASYLLRKKGRIAFLPPVISNMIIVPFILRYCYGLSFIYNDFDFSIPFYMFTVGFGEMLSVFIFGSVLYKALKSLNIEWL